MAAAETALALVAAAMTTGTASAMSGGTEAPDPQEARVPNTGVTDVLRRGALTVQSDADCAAATPAVVDGPSVLCAGCFGDSGGPAVVRDEQGELRLAGIFSFGMETADLPCGAPGINAFADVTSTNGYRTG